MVSSFDMAEGWTAGLGGYDHYIMGVISLCGEKYYDEDEPLNSHHEFPVCIKCMRRRWDI